tara:strand:+ start:402 stop:662 length:261 start_codon:yes stop_codon:yes gene_type:complete
MLVKKLIKNIVTALLGKKMLFWGLEFGAKQTDNLIDDAVIKLVKSADKGDAEQIMLDAQNLIEQIAECLSKHKEEEGQGFLIRKPR